MRIVIVGGGISGLSAAYYLAKRADLEILLVERARLGGVIQTEKVGGCVLEAGPDSFLAAKPAALELIREVGLGEEVIGSNDHLRVTYIWRNGRLVPMPDGLMMMVPTKIQPMIATRLLSWGAKIKMGLEFFRTKPKEPLPDRSVADFIQDHYGQEAVDYLAEPLLAGVYGGSPQDLSVRSVLSRFVDLENKYGSLTKGVLAERKKAPPTPPGATLFRTLKGGMGDLVRVLEQKIGGRVRVERGDVQAIERDGERYRLRLNGDWLETDQVVVATPALAAAPLLTTLSPELAHLLNQFRYSSSMTVALGYRKQALNHPENGFGFLVPRRERKRLVACTWVGTKFSYRVPDGWAVLRCFLQDGLEQSDSDIVAAVREDLRTIMGVTAEPAFFRVARWHRSMAQYSVGHSERIRQLDEVMRGCSGLHLTGNAYNGIGIPDCIATSKKVAAGITGQGSGSR